MIIYSLGNKFRQYNEPLFYIQNMFTNTVRRTKVAHKPMDISTKTLTHVSQTVCEEHLKISIPGEPD